MIMGTDALRANRQVMGYSHVEAFALMWYRCQNHHCRSMIRVWNSRDGVTPFGTTCPSCGGTEMYHHFFGSDLYVGPDYKPHSYQYYWRDATREDYEWLYRDLADKEGREVLIEQSLAQRQPWMDCHIPGHREFKR